jgi:hypothetical protein
MLRYYFDIRHDDNFVRDDVGSKLPSFQAAKEQAAKALTEIARDALPGARTLSIEVRDEMGPVLKASLRVEVEHVRDNA